VAGATSHGKCGPVQQRFGGHGPVQRINAATRRPIDFPHNRSIVMHMRKAGPRKRRAESRAGWIITTVAFDPELHRRLSFAAIEDRAALTELVREAVGAWLDRRERKRATRRRRKP